MVGPPSQDIAFFINILTIEKQTKKRFQSNPFLSFLT